MILIYRHSLQIPTTRARSPKLGRSKNTSSVSTEEDEEEPNCEKVKPQRVGSTPAYGFAFKCDERAEKKKRVLLKA
jgi:hypothetical protein